MALWTFLFLMFLARRSSTCSFFSSFDYSYLKDTEPHPYPYWNLPMVAPGEAVEEAIMLIGGTVQAITQRVKTGRSRLFRKALHGSQLPRQSGAN